jgi:hypothetical protein
VGLSIIQHKLQLLSSFGGARLSNSFETVGDGPVSDGREFCCIQLELLHTTDEIIFIIVVVSRY